MRKPSKDLQALLERIENLEGSYTLGDIAYLKAHYDVLYDRVELLETFVEWVANHNHMSVDIPQIALRLQAQALLSELQKD